MHILRDSVLRYQRLSPFFFSRFTSENISSKFTQLNNIINPKILAKPDRFLSDRKVHQKKSVINKHHIALLLIAFLMVSGIIIQCARADPPPPDADFNPDCGGNQGTGGTTLVAFADNSTGVVDSYAWDFGDGTTSTLKNPNKTYVADGNYTVKHTARNTAGYDTIIKGYSTKCPHPLIVDFSANPQYGPPTLHVHFTDLTDAWDPDTNTYFWEFGDGTTSPDKNPEHDYVDIGVYTVTLTVTEKNHHYETLSKPNYIHVGLDDVGFSGNPVCGHNPLTVQFSDLSTLPHDYWLWTFGDGGTSTSEDPPHTYTGDGSYSVSLYISSSSGGTHGETLKTNYIRVIPNGDASFTASSSSGNSPLTVQFTDTSTGFISPTYYWEFGDGKTSTEKSPSHMYDTYDPLHEYTVTLTVSGYCDETDSMSETITVTNSILELNIIGTVNTWPLVQGTNTNSALSMKVTSNRPWKVSASDALLDLKPAGTAGYLTEYDYSQNWYVIGGKSLAGRLHVISENNVELSGTPSIIKDDAATSPDGTISPIGLSQVVSQSDYSLGTNRGYRTVITFTASQDV